MPVVQDFYVTPDRNVHCEVILTGGEVLLRYRGEAHMPCWCGEAHLYRISCDVRSKRTLGGTELDEVEQMIRGVDAAAQRLSWKLLINETMKNSPCNTLSFDALPFPVEESEHNE